MQRNSLRAAQRRSRTGRRRSFLGLGVPGVGISLGGLRQGQKAKPGGADGVGRAAVGEGTTAAAGGNWDGILGSLQGMKSTWLLPVRAGSASLSRTSSPSGVTSLVS